MDEIKPGDVVKLKSGGPEMTVVGYGLMMSGAPPDKENVQCFWFEGTAQKSGHFPVLALKKVE